MQHKDLIAGNNYTRFLHLLQIIFAFGIIVVIPSIIPVPALRIGTNT